MQSQNPYSHTGYPESQPYGASSADIDPIISRLRPRDMMGVLDQSFRLYRRHFLTFLAITAVIFVPVNILIQALTIALQGSSTSLTTTPLRSSEIDTTIFNEQLTTLFVLGGAIIVLSLLGGLLLYLSQGALTAAIADSHLDKPVSFGHAYRSMLKHFWSLVGVIILQSLIYIAIFTPIILLILTALGAIGLAAGGSDSSTASGAFGAVCLAFGLIIPALFLYAYVGVRLALVVPAVIVENLSPTQALRRSWRLVYNNWWRTFALLAILGILAYVVAIGPAGVLTGVLALTLRGADPYISLIASAGVTIITTLLYTPLQLIATTLYYFDLRVRKEGFDIETAMRQAYPQGPAYGYAGYNQPQVNPGQTYSPPVLGSQPQQPETYSSEYAWSAREPDEPPSASADENPVQPEEGGSTRGEHEG